MQLENALAAEAADADADARAYPESDPDPAHPAPTRPRPSRPVRLTQPPARLQRTELPSPETPRTQFPEACETPTPPPQAGATTPATRSPVQHPLTPAGTEDSDTDFQSAYSTSPRTLDDDANSMDGAAFEAKTALPPPDAAGPRQAAVSTKPSVLKDIATRTRASSTATASTAIQGSPTISENTVISDPQSSQPVPRIKAPVSHTPHA